MTRMTACAKYGVCITQRWKRRSSTGTTVVSPTRWRSHCAAGRRRVRAPEDAAFAHGLDLASSVVDEHRALADHVEAVGRIARAEDHLARRDLLASASLPNIRK
jgi:hypothetical protein